MDKQTLEQAIQPVLKAKELELSELKWIQEGKMRILQIAIMRADGSMDLETCTEVSQEISPLLDTLIPDSVNYALEVCSPGAERPLTSLADIQRSVGKNVKIHFKHPVEKSLEWTGTLQSVNELEGVLLVKIKAARKKIPFMLDNIEKIRLAVML